VSQLKEKLRFLRKFRKSLKVISMNVFMYVSRTLCMFEGSAFGVIHYYSIHLFFLLWQPVPLKLSRSGDISVMKFLN